MTKTELLPCPFCGCTDISLDNDGDYEWLKCDWCHATGGVDPAPEFEGQPVSWHWNRRAPEPQPEVTAEPVAWGDAGTVGNLIAQLSTLDPATPVYGAFHADYKGSRQCFVRGLTLSRERVVGRKIESGNAEVSYSAVIWSAPEATPPVVEEAVKAEPRPVETEEIRRLIQYHVTDDDDRMTLTRAIAALANPAPDTRPEITSEPKTRKYVILRNPPEEELPEAYGVYLTDGRFMDIASSSEADAIEMAEVHYETDDYVVRPLYARSATP